ncbi:MAG: YceI family protein [Deltaproteobacteria bacterium]|nr:YceI family protein [Deltaproteobacteria bacterium]
MNTRSQAHIRHAMHLFASVIALTAASGVATAESRNYPIHSAGSSRVTFESDAPVENIVGVTTAVSGTLAVDLAQPGQGAQASVAVDLTKLKTGVDKRDQHMRSADFLDTAKFPTATFELTKIEAKGDIQAAGGATATGHGKLTIKGTTKEISVPVKIMFRKVDDQLKKLGFTGDVLRVTGQFSIQLSDYGINVPSMLGQKVSNTVAVALSLTGVAK